MPYGNDGPAGATRARAALSDISNNKASARNGAGGKVRIAAATYALRRVMRSAALPEEAGPIAPSTAPCRRKTFSTSTRSLSCCSPPSGRSTSACTAPSTFSCFLAWSPTRARTSIISAQSQMVGLRPMSPASWAFYSHLTTCTQLLTIVYLAVSIHGGYPHARGTLQAINATFASIVGSLWVFFLNVNPTMSGPPPPWTMFHRELFPRKDEEANRIVKRILWPSLQDPPLLIFFLFLQVQHTIGPLAPWVELFAWPEAPALPLSKRGAAPAALLRRVDFVVHWILLARARRAAVSRPRRGLARWRCRVAAALWRHYLGVRPWLCLSAAIDR